MRGNSDGGERGRRGPSARWWLFGTLLLVLAQLLGCNERQAPAPMPPPKEVSSSGPVEGLKAPAEVLLFGGADDLAGVAQKLRAMLGPAASTIDVEGLAPALARELAIPDPSPLRLGDPLRFVLLDPRAHERPWVWLIRVSSRQGLLDSLPAATKLAEGTYTYPGPTKKPIHLSFIDELAVFAADEAQLDSLRPFLVALAGADLGGQATMVLSVSHAFALYGKELEAAVARARQTMVAGASELSSQPGLSAAVSSISSLGKALDQLVVRLRTEEDAVQLVCELHPLDGSDLAASLGGLAARKLPLLSNIPADASLALAWSIDPDQPNELTRSLTSWFLQLSLGSEIDDQQTAAMNAFWKATRGEMAFAVHPAPGLEGLRISGLVGIRDGEAARKAQTTLRSAYQRPDVVKLFEQVGVEVRFEPAAFEASGVSVDRISAKLLPQTQAKAAHDLRELGRTATIFTDLLNSHVAIGEDLGVIAYGRDGAAVVEAWLADRIPGGLDQATGVRRAMDRAAPGTFMLLYAQPLTLGRAWELIAISGKPAPERGVALSVGSRDGVLHLLLDVPAEQASSLASAVGAVHVGGPGGRP